MLPANQNPECEVYDPSRVDNLITLSTGKSRPSLLFVNQHYHPDLAATGQMLTDLAEYLAGKDYKVDVLCSRGKYLSGVLNAPRKEMRNGVRIRRLRCSSLGRKMHAGRLVDYATFYSRAAAHLLRKGRNYDLVVFLTTPPLLGLLGSLLSRVAGFKYAIWSMDLHPEAEKELGMLSDESVVFKFLQRCNVSAYKRAEKIVALGPEMERRIRQTAHPHLNGELVHLPVWNHRDEIRPVRHEDNPLRRQWGLEDKFVVMYSGNAGLVHRFDELLQAMLRLRNHPDIFFLFVGEGPRKQQILDFTEAHDIRNFSYETYVKRELLKYSFSSADLHLLTLRENMGGVAVPSKLYGIMAAGRPCLMVGPQSSEPAYTLMNHGCGTLVEPGRYPSTFHASQDLADRIIEYYNNPQRCQNEGHRSRQAFLEHYDFEKVAQKWESLIGEVVG